MVSHNIAAPAAGGTKKLPAAARKRSMPAIESLPAAGEWIAGFPPVAGRRATRLILGSMPSAASLAAGEYYAHPRNAFWRLLAALTGAPPDLTYARRLAMLRARRIALWDVIHRCRRQGSLDHRIDADSIEINDFYCFFKENPHICRIYFNGTQAATVWRRRVVPELAGRLDLPVGVCLPSTSPAHAARSFAQKLELWRVILDEGPVQRLGDD